MISASAIALTLADIRTDDLNLDIDLNEAFGERVDLDKARINSTIESTELRNQTDVTLRNGFVWVRADNTARNGAHSSNTRAQGIDFSQNVSC